MLEIICLDWLYCILKYLSIRDLKMLSCVSKYLKKAVYGFIKCDKGCSFLFLTDCLGCNVAGAIACKKCKLETSCCKTVFCPQCESSLQKCYNCRKSMCLNPNCFNSKTNVCSHITCIRLICQECYYPIQHFSKPLCRGHMLSTALGGNKRPYLTSFKNF